MSKESLQQFPLDESYLPQVTKRVNLAREMEKLKQKGKQENVKKKWLERNAEFVELTVEDSSSEDEKANERMQKKSGSRNLERLEKDLKHLLEQPLQSKTFSRRYWAGAGVSPILQQQLEQWTHSKENKRTGFVVIGQDCVEPLQAFRSSGREVSVSVDKATAKSIGELEKKTA